jgi:hypothetical protein
MSTLTANPTAPLALAGHRARYRDAHAILRELYLLDDQVDNAPSNEVEEQALAECLDSLDDFDWLLGPTGEVALVILHLPDDGSSRWIELRPDGTATVVVRDGKAIEVVAGVLSDLHHALFDVAQGNADAAGCGRCQL